VLRHRLLDRSYHWLMAACMLTLLVTGFLPVMGINFAWVDPHWIAGVLLTLLVLMHIVRSLFWMTPANMWFGLRELRAALSEERTGKFAVGQKVFHHGVAVVVLVAIATGIVMMIGIDGPFWERNPLFMTEAMRGIVFVLHGFAGLASITMVIVHIYFAVRPEKLYLTRSMIRGWITRQEFDDHFDPEMWDTSKD